MENMFNIGLLAIISFVQNMAFTAVSRSRTSADPDYHRICSWFSNGLWFFNNVLIMKVVWKSIDNGEWWFIVIAGIFYIISTAEGSVLMMKRLLDTETGKRRVGARKEDI